MVAESPPTERIRRILIIAALAGLALLLYSTIHPFVAALAWSIILALALWPLYRWLRKHVPGPAPLPPLLMCVLISLVLVLPLTFILILAANETKSLAEQVRGHILGEQGDLAGLVSSIPIWGESLREALVHLREEDDALRELLARNTQTIFGIVTRALGNVVQNVFKITVCIFAVYFLFRHGDLLAEQIQRAVRRLGGQRMEELLGQIKTTVRAVVYGIVMTAIAQGFVAALGFWAAGVRFPLLLALLTFIFSFIPFGPPLIWGPASLLLIAEGHYIRGILLFIWGAGVISTMDNILRPIFIGRAIRMPILIVFIGVVGGVMSFGMIGLFVGPVVLAVALALWNDWISRRDPDLAVLGPKSDSATFRTLRSRLAGGPPDPEDIENL